MGADIKDMENLYLLDSQADCRIRNLTVTYTTDSGEFPALNHVNLDIISNKITAIVGESGSGKSTLGLAILNGITPPGKVTQGTIEFGEYGNVLGLRGKALQRFRGPIVGTVFQASQNSMNPLNRVGKQILDLGRSHRYKDPRVLLREAEKLARRMAMDADRVLTAYPHQLSGGMRQRMSIIMALVLNPKLLLLDEPTTALDLLTQSAVLEILKSIHRERNLTTVLITHDMGVVAEVSDNIVVMYAGRVVEQGSTRDTVRDPRHPYTRAILQAIPRLTGDLDGAHPLKGAAPDLTQIPATGCVFRSRCPFAISRCETEEPLIKPSTEGHLVACHQEGHIS
jgi:peptide/nickel transport system ATP-binding protein